MQSVNKKKMEQNHQCKFCNKKFHKDITLATHMCVKKRRYADLGSSGPRFGFRVFQRFFELTTKNKTPKTQEEFIDSPYYIAFVKFGHHLVSLQPLHMDQFIDSVIKGGVALKDWTKDVVYYTYIEDLLKKEPAISATERTITTIMTWSENNNEEFHKFFYVVSANEAAYMIKTGKISPWVLYLCATGGELMCRFNEEHGNIIGNIIDAGFWMKKFKQNSDDVEYIKNLLEQAGL